MITILVHKNIRFFYIDLNLIVIGKKFQKTSCLVGASAAARRHEQGHRPLGALPDGQDQSHHHRGQWLQ